MKTEELKQMEKIVGDIVRGEIKKLGLLEFIEKELKEINLRLSEENLKKLIGEVFKKEPFRWT